MAAAGANPGANVIPWRSLETPPIVIAEDALLLLHYHTGS